MSHWKSLLTAVALTATLALVPRQTMMAAPQAAGTNAPGTNTNDRQIFQARGVIQELPADGKSAVIKHEEVPNYMPAMTMPFDVKNPNELRGLRVGDAVTFRLNVTAKEGWIDHVAKTGTVTMMDATSASRPVVRVIHDGDALNVGDALPEYHFTNELGAAVTTSQFKGQALVFTFFFTRCPFPNFCPYLSVNFSDTQKKLQAMPNGPANWHLLSISFDPVVDTPEMLKTYAARFQYDPKHWSFASGELAEITAIGDRVGEYFGRDETGGINHNLRTVVVDATGHIQKIIVGNTWNSDELVAEIVKAAATK
jgi:protein SCO1/2